jgi:branched-chain amino acid transport system permease protein
MISLRRLLTALVTNPVAIGLLVVALLAGAGWMNGGTLQILTFLLVNILLAQSMNLLTGVAGQISLGHAGFFGMGAYASGILMK